MEAYNHLCPQAPTDQTCSLGQNMCVQVEIMETRPTTVTSEKNYSLSPNE